MVEKEKFLLQEKNLKICKTDTVTALGCMRLDQVVLLKLNWLDFVNYGNEKSDGHSMLIIVHI